MGLIDRNRALFIAALFLWGGALYAQNSAPLQLGAEIQTLEQRLTVSGLSSADRHNALVRLARLRQLSGNIAGAAANWLDAAAVNPQDDTALVSGAYCLSAIGEWERAALTLRPLLASDRPGPAILQARFLDASLKAWSGGDSSALTALATNPEFAALRPTIYYTLWQTLSRNSNAGEEWKSRLLAEFPKSPEARAVNPNKQKDAPAISTVQSPLWILFPGAAGSTPTATVRPTAPAATTTPPPAPVTTPAPSAAPTKTAEPARPATATAPPAAPVQTPPVASTPPSAAPVPTPATSAVVLQTGVFSREANARAQIEILQKAGFPASVSRKMVNGAEHWAVVVPAGQDSTKTAADLKKAGFDSFPVKL